MRSKTLLYIGGAILALILLVGTFSVGMFLGGLFASGRQSEVPELPLAFPGLTPGIQQPTGDSGTLGDSGTPTNLESLFHPFWQSWKIVHDQFLKQPVDDQALMRGAIRGMLEALGDEHTSYMDPDQFRQVNIPLQGEYEGIGAWVDPSGEYLTIVSPMPDSPAEKMGLKSGDQIVAIDGEDMSGIDGNLVIRRVMGPAGTEVSLSILRNGEGEPFDVVIKRAHIVVPSVESRMLDSNVAYIHLLTFGDKSTDELRRAIKELLAKKPVGLVFDLRNNAGGELTTAIEVASEFVGEGIVMYEEFGDGSRDTYTGQRGGLATKIPVVVLINEGTASASEIVAGAIQDRQRGLLVGTQSFGKGSVQNWIPLANDEGAVRVTIARWLTPNGRTIHELGLEPDIVVELTEEDINAERDPQLDKALELLTRPK